MWNVRVVGIYNTWLVATLVSASDYSTHYVDYVDDVCLKVG